MSNTDHNLKPIVIFKVPNPDQIRGKMIMPDTDPYKSNIDNDSNALRRKLLADMSNIVFGSFEELISNGIQPHIIKSVWVIVRSKKDPRIEFKYCYN